MSQARLRRSPSAWVGPAIGCDFRVIAGKVSDKIRGGRVTTIMAAAIIVGLVFLIIYKPDSVMGCWIWMIAMFWVFFWTGCGNASTTQQMAVLFPPVQGGAVVGWTSAIGAYGPFTIGVLLASTNATVMFAVSVVVFVAILVINVVFYDGRTLRIVVRKRVLEPGVFVTSEGGHLRVRSSSAMRSHDG